MSATAAPVCKCACHLAFNEHGVDITDPFHAALACPACFMQHDPSPYMEPTAWAPEPEDDEDKEC
jgi:hypothetical protein